MTDFKPTDPYHRFFLLRHYQYVDIVHTLYKVVRPTPAGAWVIEDILGAFKERWVGRHTGKAWAYQDVDHAWYSFKRRMEKRLTHARNELDAVKAAFHFISYAPTGPEEHVRVIDGTFEYLGLGKSPKFRSGGHYSD